MEKRTDFGKSIALIVTLIAFLFIGSGIGFLSKVCPAVNSDCADDTTNNPPIKKESTEQTVITYKTFSEPEVYFTFEYPSAWVYEKKETNPGKEYNETYHVFYADTSKEQEILWLHYPMYETALDTCLKFETVASYNLSQFATNEPGTFVKYLDCKATTMWPGTEDEDLTDSNLGSHISLQRGNLVEGDADVSLKEGTLARMTWSKMDTTTLGHIAHSIEIVK